MGNTRTPRPVYFDHGVVEFFVRNKVVHYRTIKWNEDGLLQFPLATGIYHGDSDQLVKEALQTFRSVNKE